METVDWMNYNCLLDSCKHAWLSDVFVQWVHALCKHVCGRTWVNRHMDSGQEWLQINWATRCKPPLWVFGVFFWRYTQRRWDRFQHAVSRCLGHPVCVALGAQSATKTSCAAGKSETVGCNAENHISIVLWATRTLWLSHSWLGWTFGVYFSC